jgi:hypothetical protein
MEAPCNIVPIEFVRRLARQHAAVHELNGARFERLASADLI